MKDLLIGSDAWVSLRLLKKQIDSVIWQYIEKQFYDKSQRNAGISATLTKLEKDKRKQRYISKLVCAVTRYYPYDRIDDIVVLAAYSYSLQEKMNLVETECNALSTAGQTDEHIAGRERQLTGEAGESSISRSLSKIIKCIEENLKFQAKESKGGDHLSVKLVTLGITNAQDPNHQVFLNRQAAFDKVRVLLGKMGNSYLAGLIESNIINIESIKLNSLRDDVLSTLAKCVISYRMQRAQGANQIAAAVAPVQAQVYVAQAQAVNAQAEVAAAQVQLAHAEAGHEAAAQIAAQALDNQAPLQLRQDNVQAAALLQHGVFANNQPPVVQGLGVQNVIPALIPQ